MNSCHSSDANRRSLSIVSIISPSSFYVSAEPHRCCKMGGGSRDGKLRSLDRSTMSSCNTTVSSDSSVDREVKVVVVGPAKTGKTSLIQRFVDDRFSNVSKPAIIMILIDGHCRSGLPPRATWTERERRSGADMKSFLMENQFSQN